MTEVKSEAGLIPRIFGLGAPVDRRFYLEVGLVMMLLKYVTETAVVYFATGRVLQPAEFASPFLSVREGVVRNGAEWLGPALMIWTLPFVWIAVSMSVRRAGDAFGRPVLGLSILLPYLNFLTMVVLAIVPSRSARKAEAEGEDASERSSLRTAPLVSDPVRAALLGVVAGLPIGLAALAVSVNVLRDYGAMLFYGTPLVVGVVSGYVFNRGEPRSLSATAGIGLLACLLPGLAMLSLALEGAICLLMAAPIALPLALLGSLVGRALALEARSGAQVAALLLALPVLMGAESLQERSTELEVVTIVEVDAPPERVWPHVVSFPDLPPPEAFYFRAGIASPLRARIDGEGVGAIRHCEFTTGVFVEPIRAWEEPHRLAFDVTEQPAPMSELSPYRDVLPPHLHGYLRSNRGEFRLIETPEGGTRLEGSTWYELDMAPRAYWTLWSDFFIHRIHERVLDHVKQLAEAEGSTPAHPL